MSGVDEDWGDMFLFLQCNKILDYLLDEEAKK